MQETKLRRESLVTYLFFFPASLTLAYFSHQAWVAAILTAVPARSGAPSGSLPAPEVYRVLYRFFLKLIFSVTHAHHVAETFAALDFIFSFAALVVFYKVLNRSLQISVAPSDHRLTAVAFFLAAIPFPLAWVIPWQRGETTPSALFLAFALLALSLRQRFISPVLLVVFAVLQGLLRSDIAIAFGLGLLISACLPETTDRIITRRAALLHGGLVLLLAGGVQGYLQFVKFPHSAYPPGVTAFQLPLNLHFHNLRILFIALLPTAILLVGLRRCKLNSLERVIVAASLVHISMWLTVGAAAEVRIIVPYLLALCVVAGRVCTTYIIVGPSVANVDPETATA